MDFKKMQAFVTLAESGNVTRAAETLYLAQSTLSAQIKSLENELSVTLIERTARGVRLTHDGELFLTFCHETLASYDRLTEIYRKESKKLQIMIGIFNFSRMDSWCEKIANANSSQPGVNYAFCMLYGQERIDTLMSGKVPIALCLRHSGLEENGFHFRHVFSDKNFLYVTFNNPLYNKMSLTIKDLYDQKIAIISPQQNPVAHNQILRLLMEKYNIPRQNFVFKNTIEDINLAMRVENCVAILPSELQHTQAKCFDLLGDEGELLDYGWYYREETPQIRWILENLT
jgi:DNA-binding transcriptional LysR family regulator